MESMTSGHAECYTNVVIGSAVGSAVRCMLFSCTFLGTCLD